jgi:hypothetical protein
MPILPSFSERFLNGLRWAVAESENNIREKIINLFIIMILEIRKF